MRIILPAILLLIMMLPARSYSGSNSDPRFFGIYCGETEVCRKDVIGPIDRCKDVREIRTTLDYTESPRGGLVHGFGAAKVDDETLRFSIAGVVVRPGVFRGSATAPGLGSRAGRAYLRENGTQLSISLPEAEGEDGEIKKIVLSKLDCGNTPPAVNINRSPANPVSFGLTVFLGAEVSDAEDVSFRSERLVWSSDRIGKFDEGTSASINTLPPGVHAITFSATDSGGLTASDTVQVTVINKPPDTPKIFSPANASVISADCNTNFLGQAFDPEDGFLSGPSLAWTSDKEGFKGNGKTLTTSLGITGTHVITLKAQDSLGESSSRSHTVEVEPASANGCPPVADITTPPHNEFQEGMIIFRDTGTGQNPRVTFVGTAEDSEDTIEQLDLQWRVSPAHCTRMNTAVIGTDTSVHDVEFVPSTAMNKVCNVRFRVRDTDGNRDSDEMLIIVLGQPVL